MIKRDHPVGSLFMAQRAHPAAPQGDYIRRIRDGEELSYPRLCVRRDGRVLLSLELQVAAMAEIYHPDFRTAFDSSRDRCPYLQLRRLADLGPAVRHLSGHRQFCRAMRRASSKPRQCHLQVSQTDTAANLWLPRPLSTRPSPVWRHDQLSGSVSCACPVAASNKAPNTPDASEAARMPSRSCVRTFSSSKASVPMNRLIVNPMPVRMAIP